MESQQMSMLSSLRGELKPEDYIQPHYKESYRLAIDHLVADGRERYQEFLKGERVGSFLSEDELLFISTHAEQPPPGNHTEELNGPSLDRTSSSGTYWPVHSDVETPDLDLGWPEVMHDRLHTNIDVLFQPARQNKPTIKEVIRKHIQDATQVIAIVMDMFTDVDIFKETVDASLRGVPVYILLDHFHLKSFLAMAENQDIKIQQLRNMRVRTVKGPDYLCRSGATFHGAMEQKFLLVDCQTAIYGSYSFTWSFEKIHLSMVQVITGHLVASYDEEFRTLYARSTVPAELCPPEGVFPRNNMPNGKPILPKYISHSAQTIERKDQLRHNLDTVYRKTCERQILEERLYEEQPIGCRPFIDNGMGVQYQTPQFQSPEAHFLKRHSYAGERQDVYVPENIRHRSSNWNISGDTGFPNGRNYPVVLDNYSQGPQIYRGPNMRHTYQSIDQMILSPQQNMTLDSTCKSVMRTQRIESYLKNSDVPYEDSFDYLDQYEPQDNNKASSFMHARMRSSLVFRSTIPEQMETNSYTNGASIGAENQINNEDFMFKRQSLQMLDGARNNLNYGPGRSPHHSAYASLGRAKGGMMNKNPDIQTDNWYKRHSVADPRSKTDDQESSGHMYGGAFASRPINRSTGVNAHNGGYGSNLKEDHRSVSHFDVKNIVDPKSPPTSMWQEPPSRTMSAAALDGNVMELTVKATGMGSPHVLKTSSKKIRSLLNIPEKKEVSPRTTEAPSLKSGGSSDTLTGEDEEKKTDGERTLRQSTTNSVRSSEHRRNQSVDDHLISSTPRFSTEEDHGFNSPSKSMREKTHNLRDKSVRPSLETGHWRTDRGADGRPYTSRFEPFCEHKHSSLHSATRSVKTQSQEKATTLPVSTGDTNNEHHLGRAARGHHDNKLGRFIQRVGSFIHKRK